MTRVDDTPFDVFAGSDPEILALTPTAYYLSASVVPTSFLHHLQTPSVVTAVV